MKKLILIVLLTLVCSPAFAYRIDNVAVEPVGSNVSGGTVVMASATVAKQLSSVSVPIYEVTIKSDTNTRVFIGNSNVTSTGIGYAIEHRTSTTGNSVTITVNDLSDIYINSAAVATVYYIATLK